MGVVRIRLQQLASGSCCCCCCCSRRLGLIQGGEHRWGCRQAEPASPCGVLWTAAPSQAHLVPQGRRQPACMWPTEICNG